MSVYTVLFDLDGTLLNTLGDLADAVNHMMRALGHAEKTDAEVLAAIGNGIRRAVEAVLPGKPSAAETDRALAIFRERYEAHYKERTRPYPGVLALLEALRGEGARIAVISNKSDVFTRALSAEFFADHVDAAIGERPGVPLKPAPDSVLEAIEQIGGARGRAVYVGDSEVDIATARNAGIPCILVSWGFRGREALISAGAAPEWIADTPEEVHAMIRLISASGRRADGAVSSSPPIDMDDTTLYLSDLDGTLLDRNAKFTPYTERTLNRLIERGLRFSIATARTPASALRILSGIRFPAPVAFMNGVLIYDIEARRYLHVEGFTTSLARSLIAVLRRFGATGFLYAMRGGVLTTYYETLEPPPLRQFYEERTRLFGKTFTKAESLEAIVAEVEAASAADSAAPSPSAAPLAPVADQLIYFTLRGTRGELAPICDAIRALPGVEALVCDDNYHETLCYLECYSSAATKRSAAEFLRVHGGYARVVGFGDNLNDLPLFSVCDECYAPADAKAEARAAATTVIGRSDEDGVARWLEARFAPAENEPAASVVAASHVANAALPTSSAAAASLSPAACAASLLSPVTAPLSPAAFASPASAPSASEPIEAVLFDLDDTLLDRAQTFRRYSESVIDRYFPAGFPASEREGALEFIRAADRRGYEDREVFARSLAARYGLSEDSRARLVRDWRERFGEFVTPERDMAAALDRLVGRYALALVTNGPASMQDIKINCLGIRAYFRAITISDAVGMKKPDAEISLHTCHALAVKPGRAVFVGDNYDVDMAGAVRAGLRAIWINKFAEENREAYPYTVSGLGAVPAMIADFGAVQQ
ncbi:MAG: HAD-IA family hydrolase [Clostridiales bacterium]|jgi:2-phosphoglycolate phosphatase|nr:HAD-IA family hydrolase [Clostridiales bacterium]